MLKLHPDFGNGKRCRPSGHMLPSGLWPSGSMWPLGWHLLPYSSVRGAILSHVSMATLSRPYVQF